LQLLDRDAYADVRSIREAMERRVGPFYLRRTKEAMVYFPERQPDGTWAARKIFTKRIPSTVDFSIDGEEFRLYRDVTRFVKDQSAQAAVAANDPRARAVGFLMALFQRRLASSAYSLERSLENRARRLEQGLEDATKLLSAAPPDVPSEEDLEEMEDAEREEAERRAQAVTLAGNADQVRREIQDLRRFAERARAVEEAGEEAKLARLKDLLHSEGFYSDPNQRLLIFTEFRDTLEYLVGKLRAWGFRVGWIHGGMHAGSRDEPGSRLHVEQQFREGAIQVLVATEAAGEGINLQCCHIMFNYDIPWNPNRLEQRMGRIHRYGQLKDCLIFNFVATNTIEGRVLQRLLEKLQEIRNALDDDAVFNVVGEVLPAAHVERVLRDYYAGKLGDADLEERLLRNVDERQFRSICQNALEGLASKKLNLEMLIERRARAQERRVVPETIARFIRESAPYAGLTVKPIAALPHTFEPGRTPSALARMDQDPTWRLPPVSPRYPRCSTDRETADRHNLEWVTPGHPLFEALRRHTLDQARPSFAAGACFYSLQHEEPMRLDFYRAQVVDGLGNVTHERILTVEDGGEGKLSLREPSILGNFAPAGDKSDIPPMAESPRVAEWLNAKALRPFLAEVRGEREAEIDRIAEHVELSLTELLQKADEDIGRAQVEVEANVQGAEGRLAQAEARHAELMARRERRRLELQQQRALTLQNVERITSVVVLPHPERETPEVRRLQPDAETEAVAMRVVMDCEVARGRQPFDVHEKNLGYDVTSLDVNSGELRLIEVKGIGASTGTVLLTPNERRVAEDRRDCYWLYVVTNCKGDPVLQEPVEDPARLPWHEVTKVAHFWLEVDAMARPMRVQEDHAEYRGGRP
jgi:hypothetical protein